MAKYGMKSAVSYNRVTKTWQATIVIDASEMADADTAVEQIRDLLKAGSPVKSFAEFTPK